MASVVQTGYTRPTKWFSVTHIAHRLTELVTALSLRPNSIFCLFPKILLHALHTLSFLTDFLLIHFIYIFSLFLSFSLEALFLLSYTCNE